MSPYELEHYLSAHIPLSKAMEVEVLQVGTDHVLLGAPLAPNINHRETVFGGSASAVAILAAWSLLHTRLLSEGISTRLVIQRNTMDYELAITDDFRAESALADPADWGHFLRMLRRKGKARIAVNSVLSCKGEIVGRLQGEFVALGADPLPVAAPEVEQPDLTPATSLLFETERLRARMLTPADADALHAVYGDAEAMRWVGDGQPLDHATCVRWIGVTQRNYAKRGYGMSALELRSTGAVVGFCGLVHPGDQRHAELKYAFLRTLWGLGLASEAAQAMLAYGARQHQLYEIIATAAPDNAASRRVLSKAGMQHVDSHRYEDGSMTELYLWRDGVTPPAAATESPPD